MRLTSTCSPAFDAVEVERVVAGLALDGVAGVARIPLEVVVAGAQLRRVGAEVAVDVVVAASAEQRVGAVGAAEVVVALAAVERQRGQRADAVDGRELVGAAEALDAERLDRDVVDHAGRAGVRGDRAAVAGNADLVVAFGAARDRAVGALAAVDVDLARTGHGRRGVGDRVGLAQRGDLRVILRLGGGHGDVGGGTDEQQLAVRAARVEAVGRVGAAERDRVGLGVAVAVEPAQVDVGRPQAGAGEVADIDGVGAGEGADATARAPLPK